MFRPIRRELRNMFGLGMWTRFRMEMSNRGVYSKGMGLWWNRMVATWCLSKYGWRGSRALYELDLHTRKVSFHLIRQFNLKANTGFDMESASLWCETCTRLWNKSHIWRYRCTVPLPFLVLNSNRWADFLSNPVLPFAFPTLYLGSSLLTYKGQRSFLSDKTLVEKKITLSDKNDLWPL